MQLDNFFVDVINCLHNIPSIFVSILTFFFCLSIIFFMKRFFGYAGLCVYLNIAGILANIQILYATSYEVFSMPVLLGTVTFCTSFLATDIINIEYGVEKARLATILFFVTQCCFIMSIVLTLGHKPLDYDIYKNFSISKDTMTNNMNSIRQIFIPSPRLLMTSYFSYLVCQFIEIWGLRYIRKIKFIKSDYIKHNIILTFSSVILDTSIFTYIALVLLSNEPLSFHDFMMICLSTFMIRGTCNLGNTLFLKIYNMYSKLS